MRHLKKTSLQLIFVAIATVSFCQSPFKLQWKKDASLYGGGGLTLGLAFYLDAKTPLFTPDEIKTLNPKDINSFDRLATGFNSMQAHYASDYLLYGSHALPLLFLGDKETRSDMGTITVMYLETALINNALTFLMKSTFDRPRPYVFDPNVDLTRKQKRNAKASFVSGHTSATAANTFFMAKVYSDYYPDSKMKPVVWGTAIVIPAVTGFLRVRSGRHYPTDVIAGFVVGAAVGYFVPRLHHQSN